jgi:hypothetical protein
VGHSDEQPVFERTGDRVEPRRQRGRIGDRAKRASRMRLPSSVTKGTPCDSRRVTAPPSASSRARTSGSASSSTSTGTGKVSPSRRTSLVSSTSTTKRAADAATIFSFVCAPPPPFMRSSEGATSSAPSTARSSTGASPSVRTSSPPVRAQPADAARHHAGELERLARALRQRR